MFIYIYIYIYLAILFNKLFYFKSWLISCLLYFPTNGFILAEQGYIYIYIYIYMYIYNNTEHQIKRHSNMFPRNLHSHNAPCAICRTELRGSHVMIPGCNICPSG